MNENKIPVKKMIENAMFMVKYAARYDRPLIVRIIVLFVLLRAGSAVNDTFILRMIINSLTGKTAFSESGRDIRRRSTRSRSRRQGRISLSA